MTNFPTLCAKTWGLEALALNLRQYTNQSASLSKATDFSEDGLRVEVNHALGHGGELDLAVISGDSLSVRMSTELKVLMLASEGKAKIGTSNLNHILQGHSSAKLVEASMETDEVRSVTGCGITVVNQSSRTSL